MNANTRLFIFLAALSVFVIVAGWQFSVIRNSTASVEVESRDDTVVSAPSTDRVKPIVRERPTPVALPPQPTPEVQPKVKQNRRGDVFECLNQAGASQEEADACMQGLTPVSQ